jgi:multicomponent Na+:H+ antiporter subunit F
MIAIIAAAGMAVLLAISLFRLFVGPTLYDRTLAANACVVKAALLCGALAANAGRADWLDAAFALILGLVVLNVAILKYFRARTFQAPLARFDAQKGEA